MAQLTQSPPANSGDSNDMNSIPMWESFPGEGNSNLLQHSSLENSIDRGAWWTRVHGVTHTYGINKNKMRKRKKGTETL